MGAICCKKKKKKWKPEDNEVNSDHGSENGSEHSSDGKEKEEKGGVLGWLTGGGEDDDDKKKKKKDDDDDDEDDDGEKKKKKKKKKDDRCQVKVTVVKAKGLKDSDWIGSSDPYATVEIPSSRGKGKLKKVGQTEICGESENPIWNQSFTFDCKMTDYILFSIFDEDTFSDELLGKAKLDAGMWYPFGYDGELRLNETGSQDWAFVFVKIVILKGPKEDSEEERERNKPKEVGLNFDENKEAWKRAHDVVNAMENDETLAKEETTSTALETLVRLAETGLPIPHEALSRVVACLHSTDRRYRLAALMISKALGRRMKNFAGEIAEALADDDEDVRSGACKVLGTLGEASAPYVSELGNSLQDEVPAVRSAALEALGLLSQTDCLQALVVLGTCLDHQDKRYRLACCLILKALGVKSTPHAYHLAERVEQDTSVDVKVAACGALGNLGLGAASVQPALVALYHAEMDGNRRVQDAAQQALEKLRSEHRPLPPRPEATSVEAVAEHKSELHDMLGDLSASMGTLFQDMKTPGDLPAPSSQLLDPATAGGGEEARRGSRRASGGPKLGRKGSTASVKK